MQIAIMRLYGRDGEREASQVDEKADQEGWIVSRYSRKWIDYCHDEDEPTEAHLIVLVEKYHGSEQEDDPSEIEVLEVKNKYSEDAPFDIQKLKDDDDAMENLFHKFDLA